MIDENVQDIDVQGVHLNDILKEFITEAGTISPQTCQNMLREIFPKLVTSGTRKRHKKGVSESHIRVNLKRLPPCAYETVAVDLIADAYTKG